MGPTLKGHAYAWPFTCLKSAVSMLLQLPPFFQNKLSEIQSYLEKRFISIGPVSRGCLRLCVIDETQYVSASEAISCACQNSGLSVAEPGSGNENSCCFMLVSQRVAFSGIGLRIFCQTSTLLVIILFRTIQLQMRSVLWPWSFNSPASSLINTRQCQ